MAISENEVQFELIQSYLDVKVERGQEYFGLDEVTDESLQEVEKDVVAMTEGKLLTEEQFESVFGKRLEVYVSDPNDKFDVAIELKNLRYQQGNHYYVFKTSSGDNIVTAATEGTSWATPDCASLNSRVADRLDAMQLTN